MGGKLDRMRDAVREKAERPPIAVPSVTVPEKKAPAKLHKVKAVVEPDGKLRATEDSVPVEQPAVSQLAGTIGTKPNPPRKTPPRLPHGSSFSFSYTSEGGDRGHWDGVLVIPDGDGVLTFRYRAGAVMRMFPRLDQLYRRYLRQVAAEHPSLSRSAAESTPPA